MTDLHPIDLQEWNQIYSLRVKADVRTEALRKLAMARDEKLAAGMLNSGWNKIYGRMEMTTEPTFEDHPVPDGLAISHEEIVGRLLEIAFRLSEAMEHVIGNGLCAVSDEDIETLNLAISALGGTPVKLMEQDETDPGSAEGIPF